jgi:rubrerythrin
MKERLDALKVALANEIREHEFYLNNARRTLNPLGKAMFEQIGAEELEHYERLKQLSESWKKQEKWPVSVPLKVSNTIVRDIFKEALKKSSTMPPGDADDLNALRTAIDFEAKGADLYAHLRDVSTDPREKAFFDLLTSIEQEHYASLKDTEEYFIDPAGWYQKTERGVLDGA